MATRGAWQLKKLVVKFCDFSGSSRGTREFIQTKLEGLQALNPHLEVEAVLNRGYHPHLQGLYENGNVRVVDVKNKSVEEVATQAQRLRNSTGRKVLKLRHRSVTKRPSIQGTWTPQTFS